MNWNKPILTDSGGFQVMSLAALRKVSQDGVTFRSHIDGSSHLLTPEKATQIQYALGSTISMIFDECTEFPATYQRSEQSMRLSLDWARRSRDAFVARPGFAQFGIIQGGVFEDLRKISAQGLLDIGFEGYAVGGLAVGESQEAMFSVLDYITDVMPQNKPRYLMGVGKPGDIIGAVARGIDMFDCVIPTRSGRNGQAFTRLGTINIRNQQYRSDIRALDERCLCYSCANFSRAYIHHLVKSSEISGSILMTMHNLHYFQDLMSRIRTYINEGRDFDFTQ
jgi:queuine tRNA-ribosyltransferase